MDVGQQCMKTTPRVVGLRALLMAHLHGLGDPTDPPSPTFRLPLDVRTTIVTYEVLVTPGDGPVGHRSVEDDD
jgi:hypothetical protein